MSGKLAAEIKQKKPFGSLQEEALLNILKTAAVLEESEGELNRRHGISPTQYNVLRILRGAGKEGLRCQEIAERMITRDPDITRLLDRLVDQGWVSRARSQEDRRAVITSISSKGTKLLASMDPEVRKIPERAMKHLDKKELQTLIELLEKVREQD